MRQKFFFFLVLFLIVVGNNIIYPEILYKISGKVVYNGEGVSNLLIKCLKSKGRFEKEIDSDKDGNFHFYVPNGIYALTVENSQTLVSRDPIEIITVKDKNIKNIVIFMEKGCTISGYVKFEDNTPIKDATVFVYNKRLGDAADTDENGFYKVTPIRAFDETHVKVYPTSAYMVEPITDLSLTEGMTIENLNIIIPKNLSVSGKIIDKATKVPLSNMDITLWGNNGLLITTMKANQNGEFECYNFPVGKYWLQVIDLDRTYKPKVSKIELISDHIKEVVVELEKKDE